MKFVATSCMGSDCTTAYDVKLDRQYTFGELMDEILSKGEWGCVNVEKWCVNYKGSACIEIYDWMRDKIVFSVKAAGGWGRMDYYVSLKEDNDGEDHTSIMRVQALRRIGLNFLKSIKK